MISKLQFNFEVYIQTHIYEIREIISRLGYRTVLKFRDEV